jgi:hypothetical protein
VDRQTSRESGSLPAIEVMILVLAGTRFERPRPGAVRELQPINVLQMLPEVIGIAMNLQDVDPLINT